VSLRRTSATLGVVWALVLGWPTWAWSCAVCVGNPNDPQTIGMRQAIIGMLVVTGGVLTCLASFFVVLWRRSRNPVGSPDEVMDRLEQDFQRGEGVAV
jgi:hypothetical protein